MDQITKARSRIAMQHPFFATIMFNAEHICTKEVPTAATDMKRVYWNPDWFADKTTGKTIGVLLHEYCHIFLMHGLRRGDRNPKLWNIACDYAINIMLHDMGIELPEGGCLDKQYRNMTAEAIYDLLLAEQPPSGDGGDDPDDGDGKGDGSGSGDGDGSGSGDGDESGGSGGALGDQLPEGIGGVGGDLLEPAASTDEERAQLASEIRSTTAIAATTAKMQGKMPAGLQRAVERVLSNPVPWYDLLRHYMTETAREQESWMRRNRRFGGTILPGKYSERMGEIVVIGDTSGSVSDKELGIIQNVVVDVSDETNPERVRLVWADAHVAGEQVFEEGDTIDLKPQGGGGTDMRVPLSHAEKYEPAVAIMITDGHTPWPTGEPPYPLIVCCTTDVDVPIGQVVRMRQQ